MILGLIILAVAFLIASAISAIAIYGAGYLAKAETNSYKQSLFVIFKGYVILFLIAVVAVIFHINNLVLIQLAGLGLLFWIIYTLIDVLTVRGTGNIIIFIIMSFCLNVLLFCLIDVLMK